MSSTVRVGYKQTEMGVIPNDWECVALQALASSTRNAIVGGPFGSDLVSADYVDDGIPVIRGQNMGGSRYLQGPYVYVSPQKARSLEANLARPGDVVFTQRGTMGQVSLVPEDPFEQYLVSQSQMKMTLKLSQTTPDFIHCWFDSERGQRSIQLNTIQTGVPHINLGILKGLHVPCPPLPEQRAIAAALSDVDALLAKLDALVAKKRDLKVAAMQQLLTGQTRLPGFTRSHELRHSDLGAIPEDWRSCCIGELVTKIGSGITPSGGEKVYKKSGRPFVRSQNIGWGNLRLSEMSYIDEATHETFLATEVKVNDVLLNITGASIGRSAIADSRIEGGNVNQHVCIIRANPKYLNPSFLNFFLLSTGGQRQIDSFQTGGNRQGLNFWQIQSFQLPVPALSEQRAIATVLSDMDTELTALDARRDKTLALKQGMMQELLTGRIRLV